MTQPEIPDLLEPYVDAVQGTDSEELRRALETCGRRFALLRGTAPHPPLPVTALVALEETGRATGPTALITVDADPDRLEPAVLLDLALELAHAGAPGAVVLRDDTPVGVIALATLVQALPLELLAAGRQRLGAPDVPSLRYECRKCAPPSVRLLRAAQSRAEAPRCTRNFFHGSMERVAP
ncbi:hypothetical protein [Streptomyces sp. GbtcB7]|uniref:hypothetical protein n=1 Tax=Streptomyces sp. GbtcB7 TaxID=2824752 RepID=UPI001C2F5059|nr:hypothetical protein [Streptomyces sp. GbtcB7]